jgi:ATP/maltotriose-dependent transcriptional regulator MalT
MEAAVEPVQPPLFRRHARRPRLTRLLDESTAQAILVMAPAGYGKTTLALEWVQGRDDVVWYRATSASADVAAFSAGLADTVAELVPGAGERLKQRLRVADTPERAARPLAELLAEDLAGWPDGALLVIDDYHLVADSQPVEDFFDWLLTLASQLKVLVTSRRRPRWASARRILYAEMTEIGRDQLAMNAEEAGRVLDDRPPESVRALVAQAEGWPALIGLAALTASREIPGERVSEALYRYFAEEVVRRETPEAERLMLLASVPIAIDMRVLREVLGIDDPEPLTEHLVADGLLQPSGSQFRFHPLLRAFLRHKLETDEPRLYADLVSRAIEDARRGARWEEAFELAIESHSLLIAVTILEGAAPELLSAGRIETLERWLQQSSEQGLEHPAASLIEAEVMLRKGNLAESAAIAEAVATGLGSDADQASRAWYLAGQALYLRSQSEAAVRLQRKAREVAKSPEDMKRALWGLAMTETELGLDIAESRIDALEELQEGDVNTRLRVGLGRQIIAASRGSFAGIWDQVQPLTSLADHADDPMAKTTLWANAAYLCVARADYSRAAALANRALDSCVHFRLDFATGFCLGYLGAAEAGMRQFNRAARNLRELVSLADRQDNAYLRVMHAVLSIRLALARGDTGRALDIDAALEDVWVPPASRGELLSLLAIAAAARGDHELAHENAHTARKTTGAVEARFFSRFAELIVIIASSRHARQVQAFAAETIAEADEADFLDAFVVAYRAYPEMLRALGPAWRMPSVRAALRRANDTALARSQGIDVIEAPTASNLTPREREVLSLLAQGLTNAEIAKRLFITESTAKVHVHHILAKLGTKTRLQAALIAQEGVVDAQLGDTGS